MRLFLLFGVGLATLHLLVFEISSCVAGSPDEAQSSSERTCSDEGGENGVCRGQQPANDDGKKSSWWFQDVVTVEGIQQYVQDKLFGSSRGEELSQVVVKKDPFSHIWNTKLSRKQQQQAADEEAESHEKMESYFMDGVTAILKSESPSDAFLNLVSRTDMDQSGESLVVVFRQFQEHLQEIKDQLARAFGDLAWNPKEQFRPLAAYYFMRTEEQEKDCVWKRRQHRFFPQMTDVVALKEFHNALYLTHLAYSATCDDIQSGLEKFQGGSWGLLYATTESKPHQPAHFFITQREQMPYEMGDIEDAGGSSIVSYIPWAAELQKAVKKRASKPTAKFGSKARQQLHTDDDTLEVALVVRGTKELGDIISDALFEASDYKGGRAHGGILQAGRYLVDKHVDRLQQLLEISGKKVLRLWCLGHSLGGGAAAIAAIEFNDYDFIEASSIGFGSPSVLSSDLSEAYQDIVTTIVTDADIVPRLSAPSIFNLFVNVLTKKVGDQLKEDVADFFQHLKSKIPTTFADFLLNSLQTIGEKIDDKLLQTSEPYMNKLEEYRKQRSEKLQMDGLLPTMAMDYLEPPGTCIHIFRDGVAYTGSFAPCTFFTEIDFVPSMVIDHLIPTGYHPALVGLARTLLDDLDFQYDHQKFPKL